MGLDMKPCRENVEPKLASDKHHALLSAGAPGDIPSTSNWLATAHKEEPAQPEACISVLVWRPLITVVPAQHTEDEEHSRNAETVQCGLIDSKTGGLPYNLLYDPNIACHQAASCCQSLEASPAFPAMQAPKPTGTRLGPLLVVPLTAPRCSELSAAAGCTVYPSRPAHG